MNLEAAKELDRQCVLKWLFEVYNDPSYAFYSHLDDEIKELAHDALVLLLEKENNNGKDS